MNKKAIQYDNSLKYSGNDPRRVTPVRDQQTKKSIKRSKEAEKKYHGMPKVLVPGITVGQNTHQKGNDGKPQWNEKTVMIPEIKDQYNDKLEGRVIRNDYGREIPGQQSKAVDAKKQAMALEAKDTLQQLKDLFRAEKVEKTKEISRKSANDLKSLQEALDQEEKIRKNYDAHLARKYEKMEEQKKLNNFLQEQMMVIRSHSKDLDKVKAKEEASRQKELERKAQEAAIAAGEASAIWTKKLNERQELEEEKKKKSEYMNQFLKREDEDRQNRERQQQQELDQQSQRDQIDQSQIPFSPRDDWLLKEEPVDFLKITKEEAKRQYELSKILKERKQELLVQKADYVRVENALNQLEDRVDEINQEEKKLSKQAIFSGNLIARASAKLIQLNEQQITELLIDDLLYELVAILSEEDAQEKEVCEKMTRECLVNDYLDEFREMAYEQTEIIDRMKTTYTQKKDHMNFRQITPHEHNAFAINPMVANIETVKIELSKGVMGKILEKKSEFAKRVNKFQHYEKKNMVYYNLLIEQILDENLLKVAQNLEDANNQYAELMFQHEFK